jgi:hypothetical protein
VRCGRRGYYRDPLSRRRGAWLGFQPYFHFYFTRCGTRYIADLRPSARQGACQAEGKMGNISHNRPAGRPGRRLVGMWHDNKEYWPLTQAYATQQVKLFRVLSYPNPMPHLALRLRQRPRRALSGFSEDYNLIGPMTLRGILGISLDCVTICDTLYHGRRSFRTGPWASA